jgi:hypothetical protein
MELVAKVLILKRKKMVEGDKVKQPAPTSAPSKMDDMRTETLFHVLFLSHN